MFGEHFAVILDVNEVMGHPCENCFAGLSESERSSAPWTDFKRFMTLH